MGRFTGKILGAFGVLGVGKFWLRLVFYLSVAYLIAVADFFGVSTAADSYSNTLIQRFLAPFYSADKQDVSTVVIIDDKSLLARDKTWPLSYSDHAELLTQILMFQPKAVFVDILFDRERDRDDTLPDLIERIKLFAGGVEETPVGTLNKHIPVFFASGIKNTKTIIPALEGVAPLTSTGWYGEIDDYPLYLSDVSPGVPKETPAYKIYKSLCGGVNPASFCPAGKIDDKDYQADLNVQWGLAVPPKQKQFFKTDNCMDVKPGFSRDTLQYTLKLLYDGMTSNIDQLNFDYQPCRFPLTVSYKHFEDPEVFDAPFFREAFKDKVVFYGQNLRGIHDFVRTPTNGQIPGVYLHAMAFDNLLKYGPDYVAQPTISVWGIAISDLVVFLLGAGIMIIVVWRKTYLEIYADGETPKRVSIRFFMWCSIVPTLGVTFFFHWYLRYAPINWIGFLSLNLFIWALLREDAAMETFETVKDRIFKTWDYLSRLTKKVRLCLSGRCHEVERREHSLIWGIKMKYFWGILICLGVGIGVFLSMQPAHSAEKKLEIAIKANSDKVIVFDDYRKVETKRVISVKSLGKFPFQVLDKKEGFVQIPFEKGAVWAKRFYFLYKLEKVINLPCHVFASGKVKVNATGKGVGNSCS